MKCQQNSFPVQILDPVRDQVSRILYLLPPGIGARVVFLEDLLCTEKTRGVRSPRVNYGSCFCIS